MTNAKIDVNTASTLPTIVIAVPALLLVCGNALIPELAAAGAVKVEVFFIAAAGAALVAKDFAAGFAGVVAADFVAVPLVAELVEGAAVDVELVVAGADVVLAPDPVALVEVAGAEVVAAVVVSAA